MPSGKVAPYQSLRTVPLDDRQICVSVRVKFVRAYVVATVIGARLTIDVRRHASIHSSVFGRRVLTDVVTTPIGAHESRVAPDIHRAGRDGACATGVRAVVVAGCALFFSESARGEGYCKWTDSDGIVHYAEECPEAVDASVVETRDEQAGIGTEVDPGITRSASPGLHRYENVSGDSRRYRSLTLDQLGPFFTTGFAQFRDDVRREKQFVFCVHRLSTDTIWQGAQQSGAILDFGGLLGGEYFGTMSIG